MPLKKEELRDKLTTTIATNYTHPDFPRVTDYAVLMKQFITGENLDPLMKQFNPLEGDVMFKQRKNVTNHIVKPLAARPMKPVQKISKVNPVVDDIAYAGNKEDKRAKELREKLKTFWGEKSLDDYLAEKFLNYQGLDPNAWMVELFDNFDFRFEKPKPYIIEISSTQAIDFSFANNELQQLTIKSPIKYEMVQRSGDGSVVKKDGHEYQIYGHQDAIRFMQVDEQAYSLAEKTLVRLAVINPKKSDPQFADFYKFDGTRVFMITYYEHKAKRVPAWRIGALKDPATDYRTCVSILDNAIPYFRKSIKVVSEADLTMTLHAFPQKFVYVPECPGYEDKACISGYNNDGTKCKACGGTGLRKTHTTGQDIMEIPLPDIKKQLVPFDLAKLVHYAELPIETARFQKEVVDEFEGKVWSSIYNSETVPLGQVQNKTATKDMIDLDSVYDTLQPIALHWASCRTTSVLITAAYLDLADDTLTVVYKFPKDFKFKSVKMLMGDLEVASSAQAPPFVKQDLYEDMASNLYADRPEMLKRYKGRQKFDPFVGKTDDQIQYLITAGRVTLYSETLHAESTRIFKELEDEAIAKKKNFWDYTDDEQQKLLDEKVQEFIDEIAKQTAATSIAFDPNAQPPDPTNPPAGNPPEPGVGDPKPEPEPAKDPTPPAK